MKFLLNNNCTDLLKPLRDLGHDAAAPRRRDLPDPLVQEQANVEGRIVITCDRGWLRRDMREQRATGLIVLQDSKSPERLEMVKETIERHREELEDGAGFITRRRAGTIETTNVDERRRGRGAAEVRGSDGGHRR